MGLYRGENKILNSVTAVDEAKVKEVAEELLKYKDITSTCILDASAIGSNGKMPIVYKNCNSILVNWNVASVDIVQDVLDYGHIKIPVDSGCSYILGETFTLISNGGVPKGLARIYISLSTDEKYILLRVTGQMITGTITTGTDTIRGITEIKYTKN